MTEVEFHTGVTDPVDFACRLLRKAYRSGVRVLVTAPELRLAELDRALWTFDEGEFLPHVRMPGAAPAVAARTPVWLAASASLADAPGLVVNLDADVPTDAAAIERLIEIVAAEPAEAERGRTRWRAYRSAGLTIKHHGAGSARDG